ncbi:alpha/beta hydrolase [Streptomyces sp. NPDC059070]|uniref:alpha/beta hydrolase n=1 Tax=Streptomyces sp. NPDC059070 TaxID=3346713 RepID=UPI003691CCB0
MSHTPTRSANASGTYQSRGHRRASKARRWVLGLVVVGLLGAIAWPVMSYFEIPPFTDKGDPISYGKIDNRGGGPQQQPADSKTLMPTGPAANFKISSTLGDGTHVGVVKITGKKSGFTGKVWVWAPKQYDDPKYEKSGFPVLIALPGGPGFPNNYWMDNSLKLESSISKWADEGKGKPFLLAMPVLNPKPDDGGLYWDGSDIPGQPKMGTWLTEDVPDLMRQNFRTIKSRDGWAFMGSSSGGFAGLKAVLKHPDKFKAVIASGPDIVPDSPLWNGHPKEKAENNPEVLSKHLIAAKGPDVYLAFQYGTKESSVIPKVDKYIATYGNKGPIHTHLEVIQGGRHNAVTYVKGMDDSSMEWISRQIEGPTPSP